MNEKVTKLLGEHWRLALGGAGSLSIAAIALAFASSNQQASSEMAAEPAEAVAAPLPSSEAASALPPILAEAEHCLAQCIGGFLTYEQRSELKLPYEFADMLKKREFRTSFEALIARWPVEFKALAHLGPNDRKDLPLEGKTSAVLTTPAGRTVQIYSFVGYPSKQWVNDEELRRPRGILSIAIDIKSGEMAGVFNGPETLSNFRFVGSDELVGVIMAFDVAQHFHWAKLSELGHPEDGPRLVFPLSGEDLTNASTRLHYLSEHFIAGMITGTRTIDDFKDEEAEAAGRYWYIANSNFTACVRTDGPAKKLEEFIGHLDRPTTRDFHDSSGALTKVEVINPVGFGNEEVWTYYKRKNDCESEQVNRNRDLADKYR